MGEGPVAAIIEARERHGRFSDLFDFCYKVDLKKLGRRVIEKLILAGALDQLGPHRATLKASLDDAVRAAEQQTKAESIGQNDLFGSLTPEPEQAMQSFKQVAPWADEVWLEGERETLGLYLTGHPINRYLDELKHYVACRLVDLQPTRSEQSTTVAGLVVSVRVLVNKRGRRWALLTLDDKSARVDVRLFPDQFDAFEHMLQKDQVVVVTGQVRFDDFSGGLTMTGRDLAEITAVREKYLKSLQITLKSADCDSTYLQQLQQVLAEHKAGTVPVLLHYHRPEGQVSLRLGSEWWISPSDVLLHQLRQLATIDLEFHN